MLTYENVVNIIKTYEIKNKDDIIYFKGYVHGMISALDFTSDQIKVLFDLMAERIEN